MTLSQPRVAHISLPQSNRKACRAHHHTTSQPPNVCRPHQFAIDMPHAPATHKPPASTRLLNQPATILPQALATRTSLSQHHCHQRPTHSLPHVCHMRLPPPRRRPIAKPPIAACCSSIRSAHYASLTELHHKARYAMPACRSSIIGVHHGTLSELHHKARTAMPAWQSSITRAHRHASLSELRHKARAAMPVRRGSHRRHPPPLPACHSSMTGA